MEDSTENTVNAHFSALQLIQAGCGIVLFVSTLIGSLGALAGLVAIESERYILSALAFSAGLFFLLTIAVWCNGAWLTKRRKIAITAASPQDGEKNLTNA